MVAAVLGFGAFLVPASPVVAHLTVHIIGRVCIDAAISFNSVCLLFVDETGGGAGHDVLLDGSTATRVGLDALLQSDIRTIELSLLDLGVDLGESQRILNRCLRVVGSATLLVNVDVHAETWHRLHV